MKKNDILLAVDYYSDMYYFLQVVKATDKTVTVRRINSNKAKGIPCPNEWNEWDGEPMNKRVSNGKIRLGSWTTAEPWDGKPLHNVGAFGVNQNLY